MKRSLAVMAFMPALCMMVPAFGQITAPTFKPDKPAATTTTPAATTTTPAATDTTAQQFSSQIDANLLNHGIGAFHSLDTLFPSLNNIPVYRPFRASIGGPFGPIYGVADVFAGFATVNPGTNDYPHLEVLADLNVGDHLRGHFEGNRIHRLGTFLGREFGLQEAYAEGHAEGTLGAGRGPFSGGSYGASFRLGKMGQVQYPYIDPLTLADRLPVYLVNYTGALLMAEADTPHGAGVHASLFERIGTRGGTGQGFLNDLYGVYRHYISNKKIFYEGRAGWVPRLTQGVAPANASFGAQGYVGYQNQTYGAGVFLGHSQGQGVTFGGSVTLARNALTEIFGLSPTRTFSKPTGFAVEVPVAQAYLFSATRGMPDEPVTGQEDELRTWNTGSATNLGNTDDMTVGRWGTRTGTAVRRLVDVTPWWHYNVDIEHIPTEAGRRTDSGTEFYTHERSDVQYTYYRVLPRISYRLAIRAVDADTQKPLRHATITVTEPTGKSETVVTNAKGLANLKMRLAPDVAANSHLSGTAPAHEPAAQDVTLAPKAVTSLTLQFQPLLGTITGTVVDAATGQPVPDAEVILSPATGTAVVHTTGPDGAYQFTDIRPGPFSIRVHKPGYADVNQNVEVVGGQTNTINFKTAAEQGAVIGRVVDANGAPVSGATVTIVDAAGTTVSTRTSGTDGTFLEKLNPGTYTVNVTATGYSPGVATITVPAGANVSVTVTLQKSP